MSRERKNGGYSLIELIVTILVSSAVMASAVLFMSLGLNHFKTVNAETVLQTESQTAEMFLTELFQEATDFKCVGGDHGTIQVKHGAKTFIVMEKGMDLWFGEVTSSGEGDQLLELDGRGRAKAFLAQHVESFRIGEENMESADGKVTMTIKFKVNDREYVSKSFIKLRNIKQN